MLWGSFEILNATLHLFSNIMIEEIHNYYTAEKAGVLYVVFTGILIACAGLLILIKASTHPVSKGLATGLLISGVLLIIIILSNKYYNDLKLKELPNRRLETEEELQRSEMLRIDKVLNISFRYAFLGFAVCLTFLVWIIIISQSYFWKGF